MFVKSIRIIKKNPYEYLLLFILLLAAFIIRIYRINDLLSFHYDQGRDALVIWDLIHQGKLFLIGPTTGLEGIFRGPFYYYLIAPFYWLGQGNPSWPSIFLSLTSVAAITLLYFLGKKISDRSAGFIAVILASFSYQIVYASRWLSNPTPMLLLSVILVWAMLEIWWGNERWWPIAALIAGLSLFHFGSAGELYYLLALVVLLVKHLPKRKIFFLSLATFLLTMAPQVLFDLRHDWLLSRNFQKTIISGESFALPTGQFIKDKIYFYYDVFTNKVFTQKSITQTVIMSMVGLLFLIYFKPIYKKTGVKILLILLFSPLLGLIYFKGNYGNIYDYYLTGYYLPFILLLAVVLGYLWKLKLGKILVLCFFGLFLVSNLQVISSTLNNKAEDNRSVVLLNQKAALDWLCRDASGREFNVDIYVPPVIPYAYDYLLKWYGSQKCGYEPKTENTNLLYTLYETDIPHPERLEAWLVRQKKIGQLEDSQSFGGITVERRIRF